MPKLGTLIESAIESRNMKLEAVAELQGIIKRRKFELLQHERKLELMQNSLLPSVHDRKPRPIDFGHPADKREAVVISVLGGRFQAARDLCGHSVKVAAKLLGIDRGDLLKIELGVDIGASPLWLIKRTAEIYNVSADYLLGLNDDWDVDDPEIRKERDFLSVMQRLHIENYSVVVNDQIRQDNRLRALNTAVAAFGMAVQRIGDVFTRFTEINPHFQDMPGGSPVLRQIKIAEELGQHATCVLARYRALPESLAAHGEKMNELFSINVKS
jgi:hypothetical protein